MALPSGVLGAAIKSARLENNLSQEKLAELIDITPIHLKHLESEHRKPSVDVLFKLVEVLHISLDHLLLPEKDLPHSEIYIKARCLLEQCTEQEQEILIDIMKSFKKHL